MCLKAKDIVLIKTCDFAPEQYEAFDRNGNEIAYLRVRWDWFLVYCPDCMGEEIYSKNLHCNGCFSSEIERKLYLWIAKREISKWYKESKLMKKIYNKVFNFTTKKTEQIKRKTTNNFKKYFFYIFMGCFFYSLGRLTRFLINTLVMIIK